MKTYDVPIEDNRNVDWFDAKGTWAAYIFLILAMRTFFGFLPFLSPSGAWTATNLTHAVGTYLAFHWSKGVPFGLGDQDKYAKLTMWEQLDQGLQYSPTRKVLTLVPIVLFLITTHYTHYHFPSLLVNLIALLVLLIAKLPHMHKVRIFGVNAGP
jgi:hypothetical protein